MTFGGMNADEVIWVADWLESRSVVYQINGGWAVDALHGRQTRPHRDLDVFVDAEKVDDLVQRLTRRGYGVREDWRPIRVELGAGDLRVDVHPMELTADGDGVQRGFGEEVFLHRSCERVTGLIGGRVVTVACAERLVELRNGYEPRPEDRHDLDLLRSLHNGPN